MTEILPNLRHLRAFCAVASSHSVSAASRQVFLSQPAVTQAINKLERELVSTLFERSSQGMFLTPFGELFQARAERALALLQLGVEHAQQHSSGRRRRVNSADKLLSAVQLRALLAVADAGNFSLAARQAGISQPSLHRAARDLERALEVPLYLRTQQGITLSRAGQALALQTRLARDEIRQARLELAEHRGADGGLLRIGTLPLARSDLLPRALQALLAEHPTLTITVTDGPYADLLQGLRHGQLDMLVGALREPLPVEDIAQQALYQDRLMVVARAGHPLQQDKKLSLAALARYPWVLPRAETPTREHFDQLMQTHPVRIQVESSSLVLVRALLLDSDMLTLLSPQQLRLELSQGQMKVLRPHKPLPQRSIGVTTRRDWHPTQAQKRCLEHLHEIAGSY